MCQHDPHLLLGLVCVLCVPVLQVTVDVPWSPYDTDGRNYDWLKMAAAADLLFIMMYDTQSQVRAGANKKVTHSHR
jgi:hypothetical protein